MIMMTAIVARAAMDRPAYTSCVPAEIAPRR